MNQTIRLPITIAITIFVVSFCDISEVTGANTKPLPKRTSPAPVTTGGVPHKQIGVSAVPELQNELIRRTFSIPGIERGSSFTPYAGAIGIWLSRDIPASQPKAFLSGREYSHFHPDGSLHAPLSPKRAREAVRKGWAVHHPWADSRDGWQGLVLIFTPKTKTEAKVVFQLIVDSYNFVSGKNIKAVL